MDAVKFDIPTIGRFFKLLKRSEATSLMRFLQYEQFDRLDLEGRVLDFGGGQAAKYRHLYDKWRANCDIHTANINEGDAPTYLLVGDFQPIDCEDDFYDVVVSLNTLEHVYKVEDWLVELRRVLKPGGQFIFTVPFMFRTHGHPSDYNRFTPAAWTRKLKEAGFSGVSVKSLYWGPYSAQASSFSLVGPFKTIRKKIGYCLDFAYWSAKARFKNKNSIDTFGDKPQDQMPNSTALALHIKCR